MQYLELKGDAERRRASSKGLMIDRVLRVILNALEFFEGIEDLAEIKNHSEMIALEELFFCVQQTLGERRGRFISIKPPPCFINLQLCQTFSTSFTMSVTSSQHQQAPTHRNHYLNPKYTSQMSQ